MADLILIDLSSLFWSAWHASVNEPVSTARNNTVSRVRSLVSRATRAAVCCDSSTSWRKELSPEYKANRPEKDKQAIDELRQAADTLRKDGLVLWHADLFEADDVIATACAAAEERGWAVEIATADKDLCQLVSDRVTIWNTRNNELMGPLEVAQKFGVRPSQIRDYLALVGDSSDNVKGVPGVGPKTASALLERFGSIDGIYTALDETPELFTKPSIKAALMESNQTVELALKLIDLRPAPIDFDEILRARKQEEIVEGASEMAETVDQGDAELDGEDNQPMPQPTQDTRPVALERAQPQQAAPIQRASFEMSLEPTTLGAAYKLANGLANSRLYSRFPNAEAIWAIIIRGREMGLGALTALDSFHIVEGKPVCHAHLIIARAKGDADCEYFQLIESDETKATYETKHRDDPKPTRLTYTIQQAQAAGLTGKPNGNWTKRPAEMLRKTCGVQLARIVYPAAAMGLYSAEEMGEDF